MTKTEAKGCGKVMGWDKAFGNYICGKNGLCSECKKQGENNNDK